VTHIQPEPRVFIPDSSAILHGSRLRSQTD
jgi:hypothetical protein